MDVKEVLDAVAGSAVRASVETVYGEPRVVGGRTVIPVAKVAFGFGGGAGGGKAGEGEEGSGGGGGGGGRAVPVAVVEISDEGTRVIPVVDVTRIRLAGFTCLGMALWVLGRFLGRRR